MEAGRPRHRANVPAARALRRELTDSERLLCEELRGRRFRGWKFRRQHPVGPYVVDFFCARARLAVELEGSPHQEAGRRDADAARQAYLEARGIAVLRIPSRRVFEDLAGVLGAIHAACLARLGELP